MDNKQPTVRPSYGKHLAHAAHEEWLALRSLWHFQWPYVLLLLAGLVVLVVLVRPLAPTHLKLAVGQPQSSLEAWGNKYAEYFKLNGVKLELVPTAGTFENIEFLKQGKVDAAFSIGGSYPAAELEQIVSLGSIEYQPLWLFYRGTEFTGANPAAFFTDKRFSVNIAGSGTRQLVEKILGLHGIAVDNNPRMVSLATGDSVDALIAGRLDGVFIVAGAESKGVQRMLNDPALQLFDFALAPAYTKSIKHLEVVHVPRASLNVRRDLPGRDTHMAATTTTVMADRDLHPALQYLFLNGARQINERSGAFFNRTNGFPALVEQQVPVSKEARRFYEKGPSVFDGYAPFWLVNFLDRTWFMLFAVFAVGYPLLTVLPNYRHVYAKLCITDCFDRLALLSDHLYRCANLQALEQGVQKFEELEARIHRLWIPNGMHQLYFNLNDALEQERRRIERVRTKLQAQTAADALSADLPAA